MFPHVWRAVGEGLKLTLKSPAQRLQTVTPVGNEMPSFFIDMRLAKCSVSTQCMPKTSTYCVHKTRVKTQLTQPQVNSDRKEPTKLARPTAMSIGGTLVQQN